MWLERKGAMTGQKGQRIFGAIILVLTTISTSFLVASIRADPDLSVQRMGSALLQIGLFSQGFALLLTGRRERLVNVLRAIAFIAVLLSLATWLVPQ
jgi:hypothetical protein